MYKDDILQTHTHTHTEVFLVPNAAHAACLGSQLASLQLGGNNLTLSLKFPGQTLKLKLLMEDMKRNCVLGRTWERMRERTRKKERDRETESTRGLQRKSGIIGHRNSLWLEDGSKKVKIIVLSNLTDRWEKCVRQCVGRVLCWKCSKYVSKESLQSKRLCGARGSWMWRYLWN